MTRNDHPERGVEKLYKISAVQFAVIIQPKNRFASCWKALGGIIPQPVCRRSVLLTEWLDMQLVTLE